MIIEINYILLADEIEQMFEIFAAKKVFMSS